MTKSDIIKVGRYWQLCLDDWIIETIRNVTRDLNQVAKHPNNPLAGLGVYGTVRRDARTGLFKMWNIGGPRLAYRVSRDGLKWETPEHVPFPGIGQGVHGYEPIETLSEAADIKTRHFKHIFLNIRGAGYGPHGPRNRKRREGMGTALSRDGRHWDVLDPWACEEIDDISHGFFDPYTQQYVVYGRMMKVIPPAMRRVWGRKSWFKKWYWGRAVSLTRSGDFHIWQKPKLVFHADLKDPLTTQIYSMAVFPYEGIYLALVQTFEINFDDPVRDCTCRVQLACSRDGQHFQRVCNRAEFIPLGKVGEWDRFCVSVSNAPVAVNDELWFYYSSGGKRHGPYKGPDSDSAGGVFGGGFGLGRIKKDRFVSLQASFDGGEMVTKPFGLEGNKLLVNVNCAFGRIIVEVLDSAHRAIPGLTATVTGVDTTACRVPLNEERLRRWVGRIVRLRFKLYNARFYAFQIEPDHQSPACLSAYPDSSLKIISGPGFDPNLVARAERRNGRYVFYLINPGWWDVRAEVRLADVRSGRIVELGSGNIVKAQRSAGQTVIRLPIPAYGSKGLAAENPNAELCGVKAHGAHSWAADFFMKKISATKKQLARGLIRRALTPGDRQFIRQKLGLLEQEVAHGRYLAAGRTWRDKRLRYLLDYVVRAAPHLKEVRFWRIIGPFENDPHGKYFRAVSTVEQDTLRHGPRTDRNYAGTNLFGKKKAVGWKSAATTVSNFMEGYIDLAVELGMGDLALAYAWTRVFSPVARQAILSVGSDDGIRIWIENKLVLDQYTARSAVPGSDKIRVRLNSGWNSILVKVENRGGDCGFFLEFHDQRDQPCSDLVFDGHDCLENQPFLGIKPHCERKP